MDVLMLCYRDEPLREFALDSGPLEVGRGVGCDIVVHDPGLRERELLVTARSGGVAFYDLAEGAAGWRPLASNAALPLGRWHTLVRIPDAPTRPRPSTGRTEPLPDEHRSPRLTLIVGRGSEARRVVLEGQPVLIGSAPGSDVPLHDRAVSGRHCRLEPGKDGWRVRDLASRNGTYVDGVPVGLAKVVAGSKIRVGRTDLRLVTHEPSRSSQGLVIASTSMREVMSRAERFAKLARPVLVVGESGSGKEGIARAIHERGPRASGPFVAVNAGGMPSSLVESELFGHEKGAFTGAQVQHKGVFEQAEGGTLFLDEIGELPLELQARLLRVLERRELRRVGGERTLSVNARVVLATHRDLRKMVADGTFRRDLYYRLAQLIVEVPPLRERPTDIEPLIEHFLAQLAEEFGPRRISKPAIARLLAYEWPGNVRELRNVLVRAAADCAGAWISAEDVERAFRQGGCELPEVEPTEVQLERVLELHKGNLTAAARSLGLARSTFRDRLKLARDRGTKNRDD